MSLIFWAEFQHFFARFSKTNGNQFYLIDFQSLPAFSKKNNFPTNGVTWDDIV